MALPFKGARQLEGTPEVRIASQISIQMAFACENISTDPQGRMSFQNVIDGLTALNFPAATSSFCAVFGFIRSTPGFLMQCRVEVLPPVGDPIISQAIQDMAFRPDQGAQRAIVQMPGITWPTPGTYTVRFTSRGETICQFPVRLDQATPRPQIAPPQN